ncbi:MAG: DUF748 domain-containing protein [Burkholderiales bacterium]|nr:DUF748 domain-containing protein [Burkholderiales bacterium]
MNQLPSDTAAASASAASPAVDATSATAADSGSPPVARPASAGASWPRRALRLGLAAAGLAALWTAGVGAWLPGWLKPRIEQAGTEALGTPVRLQALRIAPWTLTVTAEGLAVGSEPAPHLSIARAEAQLSLQSLWHRAPVLSRISIEQPRLHVERLAADRYSFTPLLAHIQARQAQQPAGGEPARFALHNIRITGGQVQLVDRVLGQRHEVSGFTLGLPFLSNLPSDIDTDVLPELQMRVDGSLVQARGRALPFKAGRRSQLELDWREIDLPRWANALRPLLPPEQRIDIQRGRLAARLQLQFEERPAPALPRLTVAGRVQADDVAARWPAQDADAGWAQLRLEGLDLQPLERRAKVGALIATGLHGELGWPGAARAQADNAAKPSRQPSSAAARSTAAGRAAASAPAVTSATRGTATAPATATSDDAAAGTAAPWTWQVASVDVQATRLVLRADHGGIAAAQGARPADKADKGRKAAAGKAAVTAPGGGASGLAEAAFAPRATPATQADRPTAATRATTADPARPAADRARAGHWPALGPVRLQAQGLDSRAGAPPARLTVEVADSTGARLSLQASASPATLAGSGTLKLDGLQPAPWLAALRAHGLANLPWELGRGSVAAELKLELARDHLALRDGSLSLADVDLRTTAAAPHPADPPRRAGQARAASHTAGTSAPARATRASPPSGDGLSLAGLRARGLALVWRLPAHPQGPGLAELTVADLAGDRLAVQASRDGSGHWQGLPASDEDEPRDRSTGPGRSTPPSATPAAPRVHIARLSCRGCAATVLDGSTTPVARLVLRDADLGAEGVSTDPAAAIRWTVAGRDAAGGRLNASGSVRPQPLQLQAQLKLDRLDLSPLQPYLEPRLNVTMASGRALADGRLAVAELTGPAARAAQARGDAPYDLRWQGRIGLADLRAVDELNDADLLRWKALNLQDARARWLAGALDADLGRVTLDQFYGRIIINASGRLNLADIVRHPETARASLTTPEGAAAADAAAAASAPASAVQLPTRRGQAAVATLPPPQHAASGPRPQLRWQSVALRGGRIDFTDNFIKPNYSARLTRLDGDIAALSSQASEPADVRVTGRVDDGAPLEITGRVNPLAARVYTDLRGSAQGIELTRLTPYAARYAGYAIEKGTLSVKVQYLVENGQLQAQNQLYLDQLTFGEQVDSPDATKLPVRLAIALLKDRHGVIDVNLPVSGSLDDPQFSIGGIVWRVIVNLITKAVTAPFSLLSGGSEELGFVAFAPGSAELDDAARARLDHLADKLADRPTLRLEATGRADPALDGPGLRQRHVLQLMRRAKAASTGQRAAEVTIEPAEREGWLTAAYKAADIKKPRNLIGLAKTLSADDMEALLQADATVDDEALRQLANRRGDRVKAYLATKLPAERVLLTASQVGAVEKASEDKGPTTRVQFTVR